MDHCDAQQYRQWMFSIPFDPVVRLLIGEACSTGQLKVSLSTNAHCSLCGWQKELTATHERPFGQSQWFPVWHRSEVAINLVGGRWLSQWNHLWFAHHVSGMILMWNDKDLTVFCTHSSIQMMSFFLNWAFLKPQPAPPSMCMFVWLE